MSIQGRVIELKSIKRELKVLRKRGTDLRRRAKQIEDEIDEYLDAKDQPGLKYNGTAIIRENKETRKLKKKNEQKNDAISVLERYGVRNPEEAFNELMNSRRHSPVLVRKLKMKPYKKTKEYR